MAEPVTWDDLHALLEELRALARGLLGLEDSAQSLQTPARVLGTLPRQKPAGVDWGEVTWPNRNAFFGAAYPAMRRALVDHARKRKQKPPPRPAQTEELHLEDLTRAAAERPEQVEALVLALDWLRARQSEWAELVEHRYFSGYSVEEAARVMGVEEQTVRRLWDQARLLLHDEVLRILNAADTSPGGSVPRLDPSPHSKGGATEDHTGGGPSAEAVRPATPPGPPGHLDERPEEGPAEERERTRLTPELLEWARQQFTEEEIVAGLRELREKGGLELRDFLHGLEQIVARQ